MKKGIRRKKLSEKSQIFCKERKPYEIRGIKTLGIIADLHIPFLDEDAFFTATSYLRERKIDGLLLNGDVVDFYSVSFWERRPDYRNLDKERMCVFEFFGELRKIFPDIPILFNEGNHELRLKRFLSRHAPELFDIEELEIENFLKLRDYDIQYIGGSRPLKFGHLYIIHGHEIKSFASVNIAISYLRKTGENVCLAHFHKCQNDILRKIDNNLIGAWVIGCLCKLSPDYSPFNNWTHGFAIVSSIGDGLFCFENKLINGKLIF